MTRAAPVTLARMHDLIDALIRRTVMHDGQHADESLLTVTRADIDVLKALEVRLAREVDQDRYGRGQRT